MKYLIIALSLFCLNLHAETIVEKEGNVTSITNSEDAVSFSITKDGETTKKLIESGYKGLNDEKKLNKQLQEQNYDEVLKAVWTENDATKRRTWLEAKAGENHPILMFELAEDYFQQNPTLETYLKKTMPWLIAGIGRTMLDARCSQDASVGAAASFLFFSYQTRILDTLKLKHSQEEIENYVKEHKDELVKGNEVILKKVLEPFLSEEGIKKMPSPRWVFAHGLDSFLGEKSPSSEDACIKIRKEAAEEMLKSIQK